MAKQNGSTASDYTVSTFEYEDETRYAYDFGGCEEIDVDHTGDELLLHVRQTENVKTYSMNVPGGVTDVEVTVNNGVVTVIDRGDGK